MHFFTGHIELSVLKILTYTSLTILDIITESISSILDIIKQSIFSTINFFVAEHQPSSHFQENHTPTTTAPPLSAVLIRELLPAAKFSELGRSGEQPPECVVCLHEFEGDQEIRCMKNCQHLFHSECIDGWMNYDRKTCPLCRKSLVPVDLQDEYNHRLWAASCSDYDLYGEDYEIPIF